MRTIVPFLALLSVTAVLGGCAGAPSAGPAPSAPAPSETAAEGIDGLFDVGGHELYLKCVGSGSPTVLYFHGWIPNAGIDPIQNSAAIRGELSDDYRFCAYDRRNVGRSDTVPDTYQGAAEALGDLDALLAAADIEGPFVLLGASFGGLLSYIYANEHPDDVVGIVQLDTGVPDELTVLDQYLPEGDKLADYVEIDRSSHEQLNAFDVYQRAAQYIGAEPAIPMIYFASKQEPWDSYDVSEQYDANALAAQAAYVDRFSPGELRWVDAPHFMEPVIPEEIADAVREVIAQAG